MRKREIRSPFEFTWSVPAQGFKWAGAVRLKGLTGDTFLVEKQVGPPFRRLLYKPLLDCTGLFRIFSQVLPTHQGVLEFANQYGQLWGRYTVVSAQSKLPRGGQPGSFAKGETLDAWVKEISLMKALLCLWDAAKMGETGTLAKWIHWHDGEVSYDLQVDEFRSAGTVAAPDYYPEILDRCAPGDVVQPAWYLLQGELNNRLKEHPAMPRLGWDQRHSELRGQRARVSPHPLALEQRAGCGRRMARIQRGESCGTELSPDAVQGLAVVAFGPKRLALDAPQRVISLRYGRQVHQFPALGGMLAQQVADEVVLAPACSHNHHRAGWRQSSVRHRAVPVV